MSFFISKNVLAPRKGSLIGGIIYWPFYLLFASALIALILQSLEIDIFSTRGNLIINLVYFTVNFVAVLLIFKSFLYDSLKASKGNWKRIITSALLGYALASLLSFWIQAIYTAFDLMPENLNQEGVESMVQMAPIPMVVATVIFAPLTEECLARGVLFGPFANKYPLVGYLLSSVVFAGIHVIGSIGLMDWQSLLLNFLQYIPHSLALAWAYHRSGNILSPLLLHAAINLISVAANHP